MIETHYARWLNPLLANINAGPLRKFGTEDNEAGKGEERDSKKPVTTEMAIVPKGNTTKMVKNRAIPVAQ